MWRCYLYICIILAGTAKPINFLNTMQTSALEYSVFLDKHQLRKWWYVHHTDSLLNRVVDHINHYNKQNSQNIH